MAKRKSREQGKKGHEKNFVAVTQRLFAVLEALSQQRKSGVPLDEITQITGLAKTTTHRLLYSLVKLGYVDQDPVTSLYMLSGKFFELGTNALPYQRLTVLARPIMQSLLLTFGESVNLAVSRGGVAVYILVLESPKAHRVAAQVGNYSYLHCTSVGKAIAADLPPLELEEALVRHGMPAMTAATITTRSRLQEELERVRREGVAVDNEENMQGIICVGGPIFASDAKPIGALSISGPAIRVSPLLPTIKAVLREAAQKISLLLGHSIIPEPTPADLGTQIIVSAS
jgi:IclR family acetate operon transcriptional repressor